MKIKLIPDSNLGKWSVGLTVTMPILFFIGMSLVESLYDSAPVGKSEEY